LFDVAVIPATRCAVAIAPNSPLLRDAMTFDEEFGTLVDDGGVSARQSGGGRSARLGTRGA
jgi:hypothetical protein